MAAVRPYMQPAEWLSCPAALGDRQEWDLYMESLSQEEKQTNKQTNTPMANRLGEPLGKKREHKP